MLTKQRAPPVAEGYTWKYPKIKKHVEALSHNRSSVAQHIAPARQTSDGLWAAIVASPSLILSHLQQEKTMNYDGDPAFAGQGPLLASVTLGR